MAIDQESGSPYNDSLTGEADTCATSETGDWVIGCVTASTMESDCSSVSEMQHSGFDDRGTFTSSLTASESVTAMESANAITGSDAPTTTTVCTDSGTKTGGDSLTTYSQSFVDTSAAVLTESDNTITGSYSQSTVESDSSMLGENGVVFPGPGTYTFGEFNSATTMETAQGNQLTGDYTNTTTGTNDSGYTITEGAATWSRSPICR